MRSSSLRILVLLAGLVVGLSQPAAAALTGSSSPHLQLRWESDRGIVSNRLGAETIVDAHDVEQRLGTASARFEVPTVALVDGATHDLAGLAVLPTERDDLADGLFHVRTEIVRSGLIAERSLTLLEGTDHGDARIMLRSPGAESLTLRQAVTVTAPEGSEFAYGNPDGVRSGSIADADGLQIERGGEANLWFAVRDPATGAVSGVVFSGDLERIEAAPGRDEIVLTAEFEARGQLVAAVYLLSYTSVEETSTPFAPVESLADQDASEIGVVFIEGGRAAAVPWAGSRAQIDVEVRDGDAPFWDVRDRVERTWTLSILATSAQNGKPLRLLVPPGFLSDGRVDFSLDGLPVTPTALESDRMDLLALLLPIPHFSLRTVELKTITPGVSPLFLGLTLLFGAVVGGETFVLARGALRSKAAARAMASGPQSQAARHALGGPGGPPGAGGTLQAAATLIAGAEQEEEAKSALLRKLSVGAPAGGSLTTFKYARCKSCGAPLKFEAGQSSVACEKCHAVITRLET